jgi:apolipoprotein N-acyltransferase
MEVRQASDPACGKPFLVTWAESFIFAGSSALLLLVASLFPDYWYFSFFALTPFLYRIIKTSPSQSLKLGFLFGLSFFGVSEFGTMGFVGAIHVEHPAIGGESSLLRLVLGTGLFGLFGWTVGWARHRWGFYPSIVALLWIGLEIALLKLGFIDGFFGKTKVSQPFFHNLVGLFGFLTVSAIIVLLNSLLVLAILKTLEMIRPRGRTISRSGCEATRHLFSSPNLFAQKVYLVPEGRAPPSIIRTLECQALA